MATSRLADDICSAFNDNPPSNWKARAYLTPRQSGIFNAVVFTYRGGLVQFIMDCDKPLGMHYQLKFSGMGVAAFGDYLNSIQRGIYLVIKKLKAAEFPIDAPHDLKPSMLALRIEKLNANIMVSVAEIVREEKSTIADDLC